MFTSCFRKIWIFAILIFSLLFSINFAQNIEKRISVQFQNTPLVDVLKHISENHSVRFVYNHSLISDKKISCNFDNEPLIKILKKLFEYTGLRIGYEEGGLITIIECDKIQYDIYGTLQDATSKEPLPFASVEIKGKKLVTVTDKNGRFSFVNVNEKECELKAKYLGYKAKSVKVECRKRNNIVIELETSPFIISDIEVLDIKNQFIEISNIPGLFAVSPKNYENLPMFSSPDLMRSLQLMPGITSNSGGTAELYIRGGVPSENLMTLDGLQLYHLNHFYGFYSSLSAGSIKDIRIYKGGFPAKYGSKISGVVDMSSKNGDLTKPKLKLGINSLNANISAEVPISNKLSVIISGRKILFPEHLESFYKTLISNKVAGDSYIGVASFSDKPKIFFGDAFSKITYLISENDVLTASLLFTEDNNSIKFNNVRNFYDEQTQTIKDKIHTYNYEKTFWVNKGVSFNWFRQWNSRTKTNLTVASSLFNSNYDYRENSPAQKIKTYQFFQKNKLSHGTVNFELSHKSSDYLDYDFGIRLDKSSIEYSSSHFSEAKPENNKITILSSNENPFYLAGFFQNKMQISEKFKIVGGVRVTYNELTDKVYFEPRLQSIYNLAENWVIKSSIGFYRQFIVKNVDNNWHLNGNVAWVAADDKNSLVSRAQHFTAGIKYENDDLIFDVDFFYNLRKNIFPFPYFRNMYGSNIKGLNASDGYTTGFEAQLIKKIGKVTGWISYSYNKSEYNAVVDGMNRSFVPNDFVPENIKFVLQFNLPSWYLSIVMNYTAGKPYTIPVLTKSDSEMKLLLPGKINEKRLDDVLRFDLSIVKKIDLGFAKGEIGFSVYNMFNSKRVINRYYYPYYFKYVGSDIVYVKLLKSDRIDFEFTPSLFFNLSF
ncbi:MAG: TonB-dependent receptor domain-containing protein [Rhodothermaceae bacterium]